MHPLNQWTTLPAPFAVKKLQKTLFAAGAIHDIYTWEMFYSYRLLFMNRNHLFGYDPVASFGDCLPRFKSKCGKENVNGLRRKPELCGKRNVDEGRQRSRTRPGRHCEKSKKQERRTERGREREKKRREEDWERKQRPCGNLLVPLSRRMRLSEAEISRCVDASRSVDSK